MHCSALCRTSSLVTLRIPLNLDRKTVGTLRAQRASNSGSYDAEGDELLREFQQYADPNRFQKVTKRLELTWSVNRVWLRSEP